jgi:RNA polymerase II subunit A small phosphatase-like protein
MPGKKKLSINTSIDPGQVEASKQTSRTDASTPSYDLDQYTPATPVNVRGRSDLRSPGISKTPTADHANSTFNVTTTPASPTHHEDPVPPPDFITQTDRYGNATSPRNNPQIQRPVPDNGQPAIQESNTEETEKESVEVDACDTLLESLRMMCCCILPDSSQVDNDQRHVNPTSKAKQIYSHSNNNRSISIFTETQIIKEDVVGQHDIKLLPNISKGDKCWGKKCLVLDLDETLVHSSFRAVPGADFVIPVQIEDIVHFVYVMKRPGVDEFLVEMAKHYEIVLYTASLHKYADPLLDLLDPHQTIRYRLFRESCVFYEGTYVKDLSLLNRDLSQTIIIDNSPASYIFHPENAIGCESFIDDRADRELIQIGSFLKGIKNVDNVRGLSNMWREWPRIPHMPKIEFPKNIDDSKRQIEEVTV